MTARGDAESFGPYAFTLSPAEAEAAAARFGLRSALRGGLIASHLAPLAAFMLVMLFASILALTGFISRRAGEATVLLAAAAFMIQRLATHWRIRRTRASGRTAIASLAADGALTATDRRCGRDARERRAVAEARLRRLRGSRGRRRPSLFLAARRRPDRPAGTHAWRRRSGPARRAGEAENNRRAESREHDAIGSNRGPSPNRPRGRRPAPRATLSFRLNRRIDGESENRQAPGRSCFPRPPPREARFSIGRCAPLIEGSSPCFSLVTGRNSEGPCALRPAPARKRSAFSEVLKQTLEHINRNRT